MRWAGALRAGKTRCFRVSLEHLRDCFMGDGEALAQRKRITVDLDSAEWSQVIARVRIWPLDLAVARAIASSISRAIPRTKSSPRPVSYTAFRW